MHFELSPEDLKTRGGLLDQFLEIVFDASIIIDANSTILFNTRKSAEFVGKSQQEAAGRHISFLDPTTPFSKVLASGREERGILVVINGRKCMSDIYPVIWQGKVIGAIGALLFRSMSGLKKIIASLNENQGGESLDIYNAVARIDSNYTFDDFIGESAVTRKLITHCRNVARKQVHPILILGETGTGKEILASAFHSENLGSTFSPFVKINCTAIPNELLESELFGHEKGAFTGAVAAKKGKFELASGGSILLDEIGDMDLRLQSKLLRVLEEGEYEHIGGTKVLPLNARVIASTNHELRESCKSGKFRPDLYYRLSTAEIRIPPLRERKEDIPLLAKHLIAKANLHMTLSSSALEVLMSYHWPGNVRELRNALTWLSVLESDLDISAEDVRQVLADRLEGELQTPNRHPSKPLEGAERAALLQTLERNNFNLSLAAKQLGVSRTTLYSKIRKHGIQIRKSQA
ncbi:MAG: sigma-54-dependent Fis family transcriptional regulator [Holophagaceae bacterium]|nr:sigma-54-dependent Fis family transcriptional regulator [Holophagaceae bacterium]